MDGRDQRGHRLADAEDEQLQDKNDVEGGDPPTWLCGFVGNPRDGEGSREEACGAVAGVDGGQEALENAIHQDQNEVPRC